MSIVKRLGGSRGAKVLTLLRFAKYIAEKNDDFVHFALDLGLSPSSTSRTNRFLFLQYRLKFQPSCCRFCANLGAQPYPPQRSCPTSAEKMPNFSAELWQLLTRSFGARRVAGFHPCSPLAKTDASFGARGRVVFCRCLPCDGQNTGINREFFTFCLVVSTFFVTLCRPSQPVVAGRAIKNFMESRLSPPLSPSATGRLKKAFLLRGGR